MEKFNTITSKVMPLPIRDVDTDMIIPAQFLTSTSREGYGENLFKRLAESDPDFPLNNAAYKEAKIIVAEDNFGCGSSREHAVWAILGRGFKVVISSSFADIFSGNSAKNGLVLITLEKSKVDKILNAAKAGPCSLTISLEKQEVILPDGEVLNFPFDAFRKHCILNGLDDIDYLLSKQDKIKNYFQANSTNRFFSTLKVNN